MNYTICYKVCSHCDENGGWSLLTRARGAENRSGTYDCPDCNVINPWVHHPYNKEAQ